MGALLLSLTLTALFSLVACGYHNPPLGPKPTKPPAAGPRPAPDGETPEQAAIRLFPQARAHELELGTLPRELRGARPGEPVPVARDYREGESIAQWVLPGGSQAVSDDMFAAMWPIAKTDDFFYVPFVKDGRSIGQFSVFLRGDSWTYGPPTSSSLHAGPVCDLQTAIDKLRRQLGPQTAVRPVIFAPSGLTFAVGDNQGREAAVLLGHSWMGPGIGNFDQTKVPPVGTLLAPEQLKQLLVSG
jgi:hypothetical protein